MTRNPASIEGGLCRRWEALFALCAELSAARGAQQLLDLAVRKVAEFFGAEGAIVLLDTGRGMAPAAWVGLPVPSKDAIPLSEGELRGWVGGVLAPARVHHFMSAPMSTGERTLGYLAVWSLRQEGAAFDRQDREMLELMAQRIALSVECTRLLEQAQGRQAALARIAAALAQEMEVRKVAETAAMLSVTELGADAAGVWAARPQERVLDLLVLMGFHSEVTAGYGRVGFDDPTLISAVARTGQTFVTESLEQVPEKLSTTRSAFAAEGVQSSITLPLMVRGELMGVLGFVSKKAHRWAAEELTVVNTLGDLLATAIYKARLYEESERRRLLAEAVIENSPVAIAVMVGREHRFVLANAAHERITGIPNDRLLGRTPREVYRDGEESLAWKALDTVYQKGESVNLAELRHDFGPPSGVRDISLVHVPLRSPEGRIEAVLGLMLDITEQVSVRQRLQETTSTLQAVNERLVQASLESRQMAELAQERAAELEATISNIADAVYVCDPNGGILLINRAGREMIGEEATGRPRTLAEYLAAVRVRYPSGQRVPSEELAISRALRGEVVRGMEQMIYDARARRDRYILVSAAPVRDEKGDLLGAVEVQSDITRLKELDLLKDQFMTVAAHEIKTPLTAIKGFAQTLARAPDACHPKYRKALETIVQQSNRIDALVQDFLDASRMRWGRAEIAPQRMDLTALAAEVVGRVAATTTKHRLWLSRDGAVWVEGDRDRLDQVITNLLDNALRYSPKGGDVEVRVAREGDRAVVSVRDQGVGIPRDRQAHVFERFYRAHMGTPLDYGGLGVGLYISREIVRCHGGEMWFESEEGKGSTFYFSLPLASSE